MPSHTERQILPYNPQQMFDLVADVEHYPDFLPWCSNARILERRERELLAELTISFKHFSESYVSRVIFKRPENESSEGSLDVNMVKGPFERLVNHWQFNPRDGGGCEVDFSLDFKFRSLILEKLIGALFGKATEKMVSAFRSRADTLYGRGKL